MSPLLSLVFIIPIDFPGKGRHPNADETLGLHEEVEAGCFLTGHPLVREPVGNATLGFGDERVYLFGRGPNPLGSVSFGSILRVEVESHEQVSRRFGEPRLMFLGHLLLAFRAKSQTAEGSYVVVEWEGDDCKRHEGIFCLEGLAADYRARCLADAILHHAALYRRAGAAALSEPFRATLAQFEIRRCEHCGKMHGHAGRARSAA
jgi:hypothetical protein